MSTLVAFHGDPAIKDKYLSRVAAHRAADELVHGVTWENGKGCAIGCTLEAYDHARYETELGIPEILARLEDAIFEGLPNGKAQKWPERFLSAIKPGAELSLVGWKFLLWLFEDTQARYATDSVRKACEPVGIVLRDKAEGRKVAQSAARAAARSAARSAESAARSAARSAESAAESAAWSAASAESAAESAESAARAWSAESAARAARAAERAASAAWSAAYKHMADKLIELLEAA